MASEARHDHKLKSQIGSGFLYSDLSASQFDHQMQSFEPNTELFNLQTGMEMLGPQWKNFQHRDRSSIPWRGFLDKASSSKSVASEPSADYYHHHEFQKPDFSTGFTEANPNENILIAPETTWQENRLLVDDSLRCVFPCETNERPSQGLSLSLSPNKPSEIGLQSFELRETNHLQVSSNLRDGFPGKASDFHQQYLQEGRPFSSSSLSHQQLKNSKYLLPTRELLNEFCNLGTKENGYSDGWSKSTKHHKSSQWEEGVSPRNQSLYSLDLLELQKRKAKLVSMLEEVDRRYRQYCEQMRAVVSSFEAVAGSGSASVYSSSASKAMSRHFRCLRDGIVCQIKATRKAMGEKDPVAPGTTRGETPRLRLLDQTLRQQRAFQQMGVMESHPWRPQRGLPERSVSVLRAWLFEHFLHPYPSDVDKHILARQTGLSRSQVSNWFINARVRLWKPMVEEMYLEETKEQDKKEGDAALGQQDSGGRQGSIENSNPSQDPQPRMEDHKPTPDQLVHHDSDSLSSIINNSDRRNTLERKDHKQQQQQQLNEFGRPESFGVVDLDFSSYSHENSAVTYAGNSDGTFAGGGANGVSLTLGLQQHGEAAGVGLSFSPAGTQPSLFFPRQHMEECQPIQYSILDGESQNLPYRNLMAAQLLHDLAG
ncbi:homeobox protein BEL1 homolog [Aristolochia californica]|uniref:homeobox protein BEL1 homolog n=1 Tax=Aristolochia californica TaxID=171875 RepID=UPI0035DD0226